MQKRFMSYIWDIFSPVLNFDPHGLIFLKPMKIIQVIKAGRADNDLAIDCDKSWCGQLERSRLTYTDVQNNISAKKGGKLEQGKSEGFESCDRPIVRKCPIRVKIGDVLYRMTLKFDGWPWKTIGHLSFAVSSFVQHFIAIGEFKLELQSGNAQFGSNSTIFRAVWPWNLTYDLEKQ